VKSIAATFATSALLVLIGSAVNAQSSNVATCDGRLQLEVLSLKREGPGKIVGEFQYENLSNFTARIAVYYGGANGRDTYLVSNTGDKWPKIKAYQGGGGTNKQIFMPGVKTKSTMRFSIVSGGNDATSFHIVNWTQLLAEQGMTLGTDKGGWCKFELRDVPLTQ
jgi:hypothetical protein